jgi:hypothetical protein
MNIFPSLDKPQYLATQILVLILALLVWLAIVAPIVV